MIEKENDRNDEKERISISVTYRFDRFGGCFLRRVEEEITT